MGSFSLVLAFVGVIGVAAVLLIWTSFTRHGEHPYCRKCGYDVGPQLGQKTPICPECGVQLNTVHATVIGRRFVRRGRLLTGSLLGLGLLVGVGLNQVAQPNWYRYLPAPYLVFVTSSGTLDDALRAFDELDARWQAAAISHAQFVDAGLNLYGRVPNPYSYTSKLQNLTTALQMPQRSDAQLQRLADQCARGVRFDLRRVVEVGEQPPYWISMQRGVPPGFVAKVLVTTQLNDQEPEEPRQRTWRFDWGGGHNFGRLELPTDVACDATVHVTIQIMLHEGTPANHNTPLVLKSQPMKHELPLAIVEQPEPIQAVPRNPEIDGRVAAAHRIGHVQWKPKDMGSSVNVYFDHGNLDALRIPVAFEMYVDIGQGMQPTLGAFRDPNEVAIVVREDLILPAYGDLKHEQQLPPVAEIDILLMPSAAAARRTHNTHAVWPAALFYENIPVNAPKLRDGHAPTILSIPEANLLIPPDPTRALADESEPPPP